MMRGAVVAENVEKMNHCRMYDLHRKYQPAAEADSTSIHLPLCMLTFISSPHSYTSSLLVLPDCP